jgi:hypothetical protein
MMAGSIRKWLYKWAWDTRCRNVDVTRLLRPLLNSETTILDAGCGEYGLSAFAPAKQVIGVDEKAENFSFIFGSIVSLPFADRSFSVATSVDVLEHLPEKIRPDAVGQLVKVAIHAIVISFPFGNEARQIDEVFRKELTNSGQPIPDWLDEHLENQYPEADAIVAEIDREAARNGRKVQTAIYYSENLAVAKYLRRLAVRSKYFYLAGNLMSGFLLALMPKANRDNAYRAIILAEFEND